VKKITKSLEETHALAADFVARLSTSDVGAPLTSDVKQSATVFAMHGDLGSGKTAFVQGVAKALGVPYAITSPTFVLQKIYEFPKKPTSDVGASLTSDVGFLVHIDAYRLNEGKDLKPLRFGETLADPKNLVFLEWPEIVADALPENIIPLRFRFIDENTREIDLPEF